MSQQVGTDITFVASIDLSSNQYSLVILSGSGTPMGVQLPAVVDWTAASVEVLIGVLQNKPKEGEAAVVRVAGTTKLKSGTAIAIGALVITSSPAGYGQTGGTDNDYVIGIALETATTDDVIEVLIDRCVINI